MIHHSRAIGLPCLKRVRAVYCAIVGIWHFIPDRVLDEIQQISLAFCMLSIQCESVAFHTLANVQHGISILNPFNSQVDFFREKKMDHKNQMETDQDEKSQGTKKLSVDRWMCDYECKKCKHFCTSTSNTAPNTLGTCKSCGTSSLPIKEVSAIYRPFNLFCVWKFIDFFCCFEIIAGSYENGIFLQAGWKMNWVPCKIQHVLLKST